MQFRSFIRQRDQKEKTKKMQGHIRHFIPILFLQNLESKKKRSIDSDRDCVCERERDFAIRKP